MFLNKKTSAKKIVLGALFLAFFCLFSTSAVLAEGSGIDSALSGLKTTAETGYGDQGLSKVSSSVPELIGKLVGTALAFIGILFLILMIYAGFLWMTARGNDTQVTKAQELITAAVIGLVIVLSAYAITAYVGGQLTTPPPAPTT